MTVGNITRRITLCIVIPDKPLDRETTLPMSQHSRVIAAIGFGLILGIAALVLTKRPSRPARPAPMAGQQFIAVQPNVELEVLDFGGSGQPIVLLAGLGDTAHVFEHFASKLTPSYHVVGITRRGFGLSSVPTHGYGAKRLGEDVVAVIDALHLARPILVGHSVAGEELSSVATYHPEKIRGVVYLDAGNAYALYDELNGNWGMRLAGIARHLEPFLPAALETPRIAVVAGQQRFSKLNVPALVIFAAPHDSSASIKDPAVEAREEAKDLERTERQIRAFQRQVPSAKIVRIPHASHMIFRSNEADVLAAMNAFIESLPATSAP